MSVQLPRIPGSYQCAKGEIEDPWFGLRDLTEDALADVIQSENDYLKDQAVELQELAESILTETKTRICTHPQIDYPTRSGNLHTLLGLG